MPVRKLKPLAPTLLADIKHSPTQYVQFLTMTTKYKTC